MPIEHNNRKIVFQSTHPCGVRPAIDFESAFAGVRFQSTHPCGVRLMAVIKVDELAGVSIHAPLRGATFH